MRKAETVGEAENIANVEMDKISIWAKDNKIRFNEEKSKVMLMYRRKQRSKKCSSIHEKKAIQQVQKLKYLGIIFDYKLNFRKHINYVADKCNKLIFQLAKSAKLNWGLSHKALQIIYLGGIQPLIIYGAPVWIKAMNKENNKARLLRVQRLINIKMAKAYGTVSHETLCVVTGLMPIDIRIGESARL